MKSLILVLSTLFAFNAMATEVATCSDPNDPYSEVNFMMVRETSAGKFKLMQLTLGGTEYFTNVDGSIYCDPAGGMKLANAVGIQCDLPSGLTALISYEIVQENVGSAIVMDANKNVKAMFSDFECR